MDASFLITLRSVYQERERRLVRGIGEIGRSEISEISENRRNQMDRTVGMSENQNNRKVGEAITKNQTAATKNYTKRYILGCRGNWPYFATKIKVVNIDKQH